MKRRKPIISLFLVAALLLATVFQTPVCAGAKRNAKGTKYYTISKKAGTYTTAINVKVTAKKGYQVYYKTSGKFKKSKVIKSGKGKVFNIKKTTTLSLCAVKKTKKVSDRKLNIIFKKRKRAYYAKYKYTISSIANTASPGSDPAASATVTPTEPSTVTSTAPSVGMLTAPSTAMPPMPPGFASALPPGAASELPPIGTPPSAGAATADPEGKDEAQDKLNEAEELLAVSSSAPATKTPSVMTDNTPVITLTADGMVTEHLESDEAVCEEQGNLKTLTINKAGTYVLTGGTISDPIRNMEIIVAGNISDEVNLIWDSLVIDNCSLGKDKGEDVPVFQVNKSTPNVHVTLKGESVVTGNGAYCEKPASAVICADDAGTTLTFSAYEGDHTASLTVVDGMDEEMDFGENDPSDGIYCKGTLALDSGTYSVTANGDCLKGTGKKGEGGIRINNGGYTLRSVHGDALKSKNGNIVMNGGTVQSTYTAGDGFNAKNYDVVITGGTIKIDRCYGDGIQGENVNISGDDTVIDIKTYFENAGINYYNSALGSGNYNTMSGTDSSKTEVVNVDTGSHKGIKGGTKAHSYSYKSVEEGSDYVAGTVYTTEASGGIVISGGSITIDTTNAGIKYNGSANSDGQCMIGSPDDGIHSNNTCVIGGGTLKVSASDDGITGPAEVMLMNGCDITIDKCYEGIEGGEIIIGSSEAVAGATTEAVALPKVKIYSNDDGINAASKSNVNYVYEDESEERYTKTQTVSRGNTLKVLGGYLNVMIGDDQTHNFSLPTSEGTNTTGSYTSDGDGIDCNGAFYAYGGTIVVFGADSDGNSPIDTDDGYYIGSGVTLLAVGKSGMVESPSGKEQPILVYGSSSGGPSGGPSGGSFGGSSGMRPGPGGNQGSRSSLSANTVFAIVKDNDVLLAMKPIKDYNYVLYSSPELEEGSAYTMYSGGSVIGLPVQIDSSAYDYRYMGYDTSGAMVLSTVTA